MKSSKTAAGVIVTDDQGRVTFAADCGKDPRIIGLVGQQEWRADALRRRVVALELDKRKLVLCWISVEQFNFCFIFEDATNSVFEFIAAVDFSWDIINHLITDPFNAMTVVDDKARVVYLSPIHEGFFGLGRGAAIGRRVNEVIENTRLDRVAQTGKAEIGEVQRMRGQERIVNRAPIFRGDQLVGAIGRVMFKGPEQVHALNRRVSALEKELEFYRRETQVLRREAFELDTIVGNSDAVRRLKDDIVRIAPLDIPVLILGESGTGKELVAFSIHRLSPRRANEMVVVNSAALPENLVESEMFGYEAGTFTGADRKGRRGKFEMANGSSLFLDEVGDMPLDVQAKLLRVLQDKSVQRVGGEISREIDFRLITATNRDLEGQMSKQDFRMDFYYRISPVVLTVPPLRERIGDIPLLVDKFLSEFAARHQRGVPEVDSDVYSLLAEQQWPGNIRQLRHAVERAIIFCENNRITVHDFGRSGIVASSSHPVQPVAKPTGFGEEFNGEWLHGEGHGLQQTLDLVETKLIQDALVRHNGNKKRVAEHLGISRSYLYKKLGLS